MPLLFLLLVAKSSRTLLRPHGLWPTRLHGPWDFPGKNTGAGCHSPLQGIFQTQGSNPSLFGLLHWQANSLPRSHLGSPVASISEVSEVARCVRLFATPWTVPHQAPPSMGFSRQEYWSGLPFPSAGDLPNSGIEPWSPTLQTDALPSEPAGKPTAL